LGPPRPKKFPNWAKKKATPEPYPPRVGQTPKWPPQSGPLQGPTFAVALPKKFPFLGLFFCLILRPGPKTDSYIFLGVPPCLPPPPFRGKPAALVPPPPFALPVGQTTGFGPLVESPVDVFPPPKSPRLWPAESGNSKKKTTREALARKYCFPPLAESPPLVRLPPGKIFFFFFFRPP